MERIANAITLLSKLIVAYLFGSHGVKALFMHPDMLSYFHFVGFAPEISKVLLFIVGTADMLVVLFILLKPTKLLGVWTIFWPIVPSVVESLSHGISTHAINHLVMAPLAGVLFYTTHFTEITHKTLKKIGGKK